MPRRQVDHEPADLAVLHRREPGGDDFDVPVHLKPGARVEFVKRALGEGKSPRNTASYSAAASPAAASPTGPATGAPSIAAQEPRQRVRKFSITIRSASPNGTGAEGSGEARRSSSAIRASISSPPAGRPR
jgi:hypothetical protein